jgi:glycosyltransferase involved in cell wall biosynthesis
MNTSGKTVLFIFPHFSRYEINNNPESEYFRELILANQLLSQGLKVKVYFVSDKVYKSSLIESFSPDAANTLASTEVYSTRLSEGVKKFKPDIVIIKGAGYRLTRNLWISAQGAFKVIFIVGGGLYDYLFPIAEHIFSEFPGQTLYCGPLWYSKSKISHLGKKTLLAADRQKDQKKKFDIISVGRLITTKNLKALCELSSSYKIIIVGDGPERHGLEALAKFRGLNITFAGHLSQNDTANCIAESRLMVHPSTSEGFPRVFYEALTLGVPVVGLEGVYGSYIRAIPGVVLVEMSQLREVVEQILNNDNVLASLRKDAELAGQDLECDFKKTSAEFCNIVINKALNISKRKAHVFWLNRFFCEIYYLYRRVAGVFKKKKRLWKR